MTALQWLMITKKNTVWYCFLRSTKTVKRSVSNMITVIQTSTSLILKEPFGRTWPCKKYQSADVVDKYKKLGSCLDAEFSISLNVILLFKTQKTNFNVFFIQSSQDNFSMAIKAICMQNMSFFEFSALPGVKTVFSFLVFLLIVWPAEWYVALIVFYYK